MLTGPDLKNVTQRQNRDWLVKWIVDPEGVLASGDPYAIKLQKEARGAVMRNIPGMTPELANALLDFIEAESKKEKSKSRWFESKINLAMAASFTAIIFTAIQFVYIFKPNLNLKLQEK